MMRRRITICGGALVALLLSGCSTTLQTTSGVDWLGAIPPAAQASSDIDQRVREVANVEPILRFPARIGLARIGQENSRPSLIPPPPEEAKAWVDLGEDLGPEYGEFVPISPLIAAMLAPPHAANARTDMIKDTLEMIRLAAARQHLDAVLIYEVDGTANSKNRMTTVSGTT